MEYLTPNKIAEITGGDYIGEELARGVQVKGAVRDNRDVKPGNLFICIRGARADGHDFANMAFASGAACCLAERVLQDAQGPYVLVNSTLEAIKTIGKYYRSLFDIPVIGITGSVGKTTTKEMTAAVLGAKFRVLKTQENLNNELGVPLTLLSLDDRYEAAVIEMGISDFGEMGRLADMVRPDICIMTKIGYSHIETFGDLNGVLRAKSEVFAYIRPDGAAVVNGDDELLKVYDPGIHKITFGLDAHNDFRADNVHTEGTETVKFDIVSGSGHFPVTIPAYGIHLVSAALAAAATGRQLGMTDEEIRRGLFSYKPTEGRSNVKDTGFITLIDDCYNANPNSVKAALTSLSSLQRRRVAILGDMLELGEQAEQLHREIGEIAARSGISRLICSGENAVFIYEGYISADGDDPWYFPDKTELISAIPELIEKHDAVLVKASNGMKFKEIIPMLETLQDSALGDSM